MKIIHCGDIHLDSRMQSNLPAVKARERNAEICATFVRMVTFAAEKGVAAILMAGIDGIKNKIDPHENGWGPYDMNLFNLPEEEKAKLKGLPTCLEDALDALEADNDYLTEAGVFPKELITNFIKAKRAECSELSKIPHPAEFDKYYNL